MNITSGLEDHIEPDDTLITTERHRQSRSDTSEACNTESVDDFTSIRVCGADARRWIPLL